MPVRTRGILAAFAAGVLMTHAFAAQAADILDNQQFEQRYSGQAVSALNFKIEGGYIATDFGGDGEFDTAHGEYVQGSASLPLGSMLGFQIDAGYLKSDVDGTNGFEDFGIDAHGIGGHLFWRDPALGLLGAYGHQSEYDFHNGPDDRVKNFRLGIEGEAYLGNFTLKAFAGNDTLDWNFAKDAERFLAVKGEVDFYINDNFMVFAGVEHAFESTTGKVGFESLFDTGSVSSSLFAEAKFDEDSRTVMAGLRIYFGPQGRSLKARHREDDPAIDLFGNFAAIGRCMNNALGGGSIYDSMQFQKVSGILPTGLMDLKDMKKSQKAKLDGCTGKEPAILSKVMTY